MSKDVLGNNFNLHAGDVLTESIVEDADTDVILYTQRKARDYKTDTTTEEGYYRCCGKSARAAAVAMAEAGYICYYPAFEDMLGEVQNKDMFLPSVAHFGGHFFRHPAGLNLVSQSNNTVKPNLQFWYESFALKRN